MYVEYFTAFPWGGTMSLTQASSGYEFEAIHSMLDALLKSESASEFCRALVHGGIVSESIQGCHIYLLDNSSNLSAVAGYGMVYETEKTELSAWDENPVSNAVRKKDYVFDASNNVSQPVVAIPLLRDSIPIGCLGLVLNDGTKDLPFQESLIPILSKLGAYCLANLSYSASKNGNREPNGEDLTSRQIEILDFMAEGFVNAEIAANLMLSESTIRQESVRIYRALGVPNRAEAAKKGRALGLIKRSNSPSA
jgi:DNA-binding CsgD family transcriptional regulator